MKQTEIGSAWHAVRGHAKLPSNDIREGLYNLLVGFHGSPAIHELARKSGDDHDEILGLIDTVEESLLQERMVYVAIRLRILDDYLSAKKLPGYGAISSGWIVGRFGPISESMAALDLREACNKIIHAELFNWVVFGASRERSRGLTPQIRLYGRRGRAQWRASIDVTQFVRCAMHQLEFAS